jgi:hypothetical protein
MLLKGFLPDLVGDNKYGKVGLTVDKDIFFELREQI